MKKNREDIKFKARSYSKKGIMSMLAGILSAAVFAGVSLYSASYRGKAGMAAGVAAMASFAVSLVGFITAYKSFKERDIYFWPSITGIFLNGIMLIVYMSLYVIGIA